MNKTEMKNIIEDTLGNSLTIEQAATLEYIGKLAKEIAWEKSGVYRNAEERATHKKQPLSVAEHMDDLSITLGDKVITVAQDKDTAPAVSTPFGLSDRVTQASLPKDWMIQSLYQFIIDCKGGDTAFATRVQGFINECLDFATIHNDDGSIQKIDASMLPSPAMAVFTEDVVTSHKRQTRSKAKGSTAFNIRLIIEENDLVIPRIPVRNTGFVAVHGIVSPVAPTPTGHPLTPLVDEEDYTPSAPIVTVDKVAVEMGVGLTASDLLQSVMSAEPMTKGDIRKAVCEQIAEPMWVAELDLLVDAGVVVKTTNGGPRSTRYTMAVIA